MTTKCTIVRPLSPHLWDLLLWQKSQSKVRRASLDKKLELMRHGGELTKSILTVKEWNVFVSWQSACANQQGDDCIGCGLREECLELYDWVQQLNRHFSCGPINDMVGRPGGNPYVECSSEIKFPITLLGVKGCAVAGDGKYRHKVEMGRVK